MWLLVVLACSPSTGTTSSEVEPWKPDPPEQVPAAPNSFGPCSDVFDQDRLATYDLDISAGEWAAMQAEFAAQDGSKPYHPAVFRSGDEVYNDARVRLKGNEAYSWVGTKMQMVVKFDDVDPNKRFHGVAHLAFDAPWYDPSLLHNRLANAMLADMGLPYYCTANARLDVNGVYQGLYAVMEQADGPWRKRIYGDSDGGYLWKYGLYAASPDDEADADRMTAFWAATDLPTMEGLGDVDEWTQEWAAEAVMGDADGYLCCTHNFYVYDHPDDGMLFVPWDLDATLGYWDDATTDPLGFRPWTWLPTQHQDAVLADATWRARYVDHVANDVAAWDPDESAAAIDAWNAQIEQAVTDDTNKPFATSDHDNAVAVMRQYVLDRHAWLETWVDCAEGGDTGC